MKYVTPNPQISGRALAIRDARIGIALVYRKCAAGETSADTLRGWLWLSKQMLGGALVAAITQLPAAQPAKWCRPQSRVAHIATPPFPDRARVCPVIACPERTRAGTPSPTRNRRAATASGGSGQAVNRATPAEKRGAGAAG
jgi:uncharacterized protein (DUF433 family)